jgi:hypothetical protein
MTTGGEIYQCYATGNVIITGNINFRTLAGGFCGDNQNAMSNCYARGNVTSINAAFPAQTFAAGFIARNLTAIDDCYSTGIPTAANVGGFIADNTFIPLTEFNDCYWDAEASGTVVTDGGVSLTTAQAKTQASFVGWDFVAIWDIGGGINDNYPYLRGIAPPLPPVSHVGGFCGEIAAGGAINNSFWDTQLSGTLVSDGGTGKTTAQMKDNPTFTDAGWNFITIWNRYEHCNDGYPCLYRVTPSCFVLSSVLSVSTLQATGITDQSAVLNGILDDNAGQVCETRFQWGASSSYGMVTEWKGARYKGTIFNEALVNMLSPGCLYHFRAQARSRGVVESGRDMMFTTIEPGHMMTLLPMELAEKLGG